MMEAARTSETTVDIELRTRQYIPELWTSDAWRFHGKTAQGWDYVVR
jgi:hypothetical protein